MKRCLVCDTLVFKSRQDTTVTKQWLVVLLTLVIPLVATQQHKQLCGQVYEGKDIEREQPRL